MTFNLVKETEAETVITSHELLPKFKRILKDKEDKVKTIVYLENPIKRTDVSGYRLAETHFSNLHDIYIYVFSRTVQSTTTQYNVDPARFMQQMCPCKITVQN